MAPTAAVDAAPTAADIAGGELPVGKIKHHPSISTVSALVSGSWQVVWVEGGSCTVDQIQPRVIS